jgi:hypothetical protein
MLIGTDLIITAKTQCQLEKLLKDCSQYFDPATMTVLEFLIFDEGHANLESYVNDYVHGEPDVIRCCILKFESALLEDSDLQQWQKQGEYDIKKNQDKMYKDFRIYPSDLVKGINWDALANEVEMLEE